MKIILFGTDVFYNRYKIWFQHRKIQIVALVDNNVLRQGKCIDGLTVISPNNIEDVEYDRIYILSSHHKAIRSQLEKYGINGNIIFSYEDIYDSLQEYRIRQKQQFFMPEVIYHSFVERKKIALLSNEMTLTGAPIALLRVAIILRDDYDVYFYSKYDGPLREECLNKGIPVIVDPNMDICTFDDLPWLREYDLVWVNTVLLYNLFLSNHINIPVFWWLHDSELIYRGIDEKRINAIQLNDSKLLTVGEVPYKVFLKRVSKEYPYIELLYGIPDNYSQNKKECSLIRFAVIGTISHTKGQDILLNAIGKMSNHICKQCSFKFIGNNESVYAQELQKRSFDGIDITYTGILLRSEIDKLFDEIDVLICPSRSDSMPTVVTEAMMHHVPAIVSDVTGTVKYIVNGVNGLIFNSEDDNDLKSQIEWIVRHKGNIKRMGDCARKVYDTHFSMDVLKSSLLQIVGDVLK